MLGKATLLIDAFLVGVHVIDYVSCCLISFFPCLVVVVAKTTSQNLTALQPHQLSFVQTLQMTCGPWDCQDLHGFLVCASHLSLHFNLHGKGQHKIGMMEDAVQTEDERKSVEFTMEIFWLWTDLGTKRFEEKQPFKLCLLKHLCGFMTCCVVNEAFKVLWGRKAKCSRLCRLRHQTWGESDQS